MSDLAYWILFALAGIVLIVLVWFTLTYMEAEGQNATPPAPVPPKPVTSPPNPTPTTPTPNFQYLPQKAYVLPFAPENGVPSTTPLPAPLTTPVQPIPVQPAPVQQAAPTLGIPGMDIAGLLALLGVGANYVKTHLLNKTVKQNSTNIVESKTVEKELARLMFDKDPEWANKINDSPETKLQQLKDNVKTATETAAKA